MSWLFSQALVAEYSAANSLDGAPSAPSNTTATPQAFLWRDKTTDAWKRFPSGLTCEPLTENRGEELLTWFREGFHAPTSVAVATRRKASRVKKAGFGERWRDLLMKYDRPMSLWRTHRSLFQEVLSESSVTLPKWGMMLDGELWALPTPDWGTYERGCGWWATPLAHLAKGGPAGRGCRERGGRRSDLRTQAGLASIHPGDLEQVMGFPSEWTELNASAMPKFQQWLRSHGVCSEGRAMTEEAA
jgi:hypothetical protein